tara:strand:- start:15969 stop:16949 length:981 start_codon:yes stop_codon:yes gene_type:complete
MTLCRVQHNKNNPYVVLNKEAAVDNRLSWKAKGIYFYAFSRPNDWQFYVSDLIKQSTDGEDSVTSGLKELESKGYLFRSQKNNNGRFEKMEWMFYETPRCQGEIKEILPQPGFPVPVQQDTENPGLLSTERLSNERKLLPRKLEQGQKVDPSAIKVPPPSAVSAPTKETNSKEKELLPRNPPEIKPSKTLAAVVVPSLCSALGADVESYSKLLKYYTEAAIINACKVANSQGTRPENFFGWVRECIEKEWKAKVVAEDEIPANRKFAQENLDGKSAGLAKLVATNQYVEFVYVGAKQPDVFSYSLPNFILVIKNHCDGLRDQMRAF